MSGGWETLLLIALIILVPSLLLYNLDLNPRSWHDEGDALTLARTLAEDGYYGVRLSDGYQTFGIVQSVGPAVILPATLAFKVFGSSLVVGRIVAVGFALLTLVLFFLTGKALIGRRAALIGIIILISTGGVRFFYVAKQFIGLVPALGFFLASFLLWYHAIKSNKIGLAILSGLLLGCAILTKSQYLVLGLGAFGLIAILDLLYYHLGAFKHTGMAIAVALGCYGAWSLWQRFHYGPVLFAENADYLYRLAQVAYGFRPSDVIAGFQRILGDDTGHYFIFWGFLAIAYTGFNSIKKDIQSLGLALLLIFTGLNLGFALFWTMPWIWHFFAPLASTILLICKMYDDLAVSAARSGALLKSKVIDWIKNRNPISIEATAVIGTLVAIATFSLWVGYELKQVVAIDVLDQVGDDKHHWPSSFSLPYQTADFLNQVAAPDSIIETSERELAILTNFNYHSPDQSILIDVIPCEYHKTEENDYRLGREYFDSTRAAYLVIGYFSRAHDVYDMEFVSANFEQIKLVGYGSFEYVIYQRITPIPS